MLVILGWALLFLSYTLIFRGTFCVFLVKSGDLCLSFFSSLAFGGFYFLFIFLPNFMHVLFALLFPLVLRWFLLRISISVLLFFFVCCFQKTNMLWLRGDNKGYTSVWDVETWLCVISNLDLDLFVVWILGQNLNSTPLIVVFFFISNLAMVSSSLHS